MTDQPQSTAENVAPAENGSRADIAAMVTTLARAIVHLPEEVLVEVEQDGPETVYWLIVAEEDIPLVIGRSGKTIRSLRTIVEAAGQILNQRCVLELVEEDEGEDGDFADDASAEAAPPSEG